MGPARELAPNDVLDRRYRLVDRLGRGGFGDVWRAEELLPDGTSFRDVALKLLHAGVPDQSWAEEAKLLASLRHPSLVTIYAAGILAEPAVPYVAMELLLGMSLADKIRGGARVPWRRVLYWARETAAALDVIHLRNIVHLDLKPANLFLTQDGDVKVLDFGISRRAGSKVTSERRPAVSMASEDGAMATAVFVEKLQSEQSAYDVYGATIVASSTERAVVGTPGFVAPEVLELREPTAASDAFALAVCIVQLVTGGLPQAVPDEPVLWTDPDAISAWWTDLRNATLQGRLRDLSVGDHGMPPGMVRLVRKLLSVDPDKRGVEPGGLREVIDDVWERPYGVPANPFTGLEPLPQDREGALFGRDDEIARFARDLEFETAVVVQGGKGAGKTSIVRAGIVPALARRMVDERDDWVVERFEPGNDPDAALAAALARIDPSLGEASTPTELAERCAARNIGVVLFVDELEAVAHAEPERRQRFVSYLAALVPMPRSRGLRFVAGLREGGTAAVLEIAELGAAIRPALRFLGPPTTSAARELVVGPAKLAEIEIVDRAKLVAHIEAELRAGAACLPYVSLGLQALWRRARKGGGEASVLDGRAFLEDGGVGGCVARHAESVRLALAPGDERTICDELLVRLATTEGVLVRTPEAELCDALADSPVVARVIEALVASFVVRRSGRDSERTIELGHASLLTSWPHLASARLSAMDRLNFLERLREAALAWDRAGSHPVFLWSESALREVSQNPSWVLRGITPREHEFIAASRSRARRRAAWRLAAIAFAALVVVLGFWGKRALEEKRSIAEEREREAVKRAYAADAMARSRREEDPYRRIAWILEALESGATEASLPVELGMTALGLPYERVVTLEHIESPSMPWGPRFVIGEGPNSKLAIVDLEPREAQVVEHMEIDADLDDPRGWRKVPRLTMVRPHEAPLVQREALGFGYGLVTRSGSGEVRVFRINGGGVLELAATAPMRCVGPFSAATRAPVVVCPTAEGLARWNLATGNVDRNGFQGSVLTLSADGQWIASVLGRGVHLWAPEEAIDLVYEAADQVVLGAWSPRDSVLAVIQPSKLEIIDPAAPVPVIFEQPLPLDPDDVDGRPLLPAAARWDEGGLDLAICRKDGKGAWFYLRNGARSPDDPVPAVQRAICADPHDPERDPAPMNQVGDFGALAEWTKLGRELSSLGWRVPNGRWVTKNLRVFDDAKSRTSTMLRFVALTSTGEEDLSAVDGPAQIARADRATIVVEVGGTVRLYDNRGRRLLSRDGRYLGRCPTGAILGWRAEGTHYRIFNVATDADVGRVPRTPGFLLGVDASCKQLLHQELDGTLVLRSIGEAAPKTLARADGYAYLVKSWGGALLLALSSGAIVRVDPEAATATVLGYATPRVSVLGGGPGANEVTYGDSTGITTIDVNGATRKILDPQGGVAWEDIATTPSGSFLLVAHDQLGVLDPVRREIVASFRHDGIDRFSSWDEDGSVLMWGFYRVGPVQGTVVPLGLDLARALALASSNLRVQGGTLAVDRD